MFNWDYRHRSDRIKLFLFIFFLFSCVSMFVVFLSGGFQEIPEKTAHETEMAKPTEYTDPQPTSQSSPSTDKELIDPPESKQIISESEQMTSREVAQAFVEAYYAYDPKHPELYIKNSKPFMSENLYLNEKDSIRRQTLDRETTTVIGSEVWPVDHDRSNEIVWGIIVEGEAIASTGEVYTETPEYFVTLRKYDGEWKVNNFRIENWGE